MARRIVKRPARSNLVEYHGIYTQAPEMKRVLRVLERAARADCTVLINGETGTGKELAARAIHATSPRSEGPFLARNCATLSPTLLESELFGHVRGAFTGAIREKKGVFQLANGGTLFLDEVAETPSEIQGRLLRVLQEKTFVPVGSVRSISVDVRLISATNKPLAEEVAAGRFRNDLRFRLRVVPLVLPPLRRRSGDAEALLWHLIGLHNEQSELRTVEAVTSDVFAAVGDYEWPGNVRELQNAVEYAFVVGEGPVLDLQEMPPEIRGERPSDADRSAGGKTREEERRRLLRSLSKHQWKREHAARALGMSRSTLWRKMREHGLGRRKP